MSILPSRAVRSTVSLKQKHSKQISLEHGRDLHSIHGGFEKLPEASESVQEAAGSNPGEWAPAAAAGISEFVNGVSGDYEDSTSQLGRPSKEFVARNVDASGIKNGFDHSKSHSTRSGDLSRTLRIAETVEGNSSDLVGSRNFEQSNAGTSALPPPNTATRGRKSQMLNANHLLNFQFNPIPRVPRATARNPPPRRHRRAKPYDKDLFLQANFRFLVSDMGDYELNSSNPDKMLEWEDVAAVKYSASAPVKCPICLESPPLCPQITTCGHIFCFPCVLKYLMMGEKNSKADRWKKCPLCSIMVSCKDLHNVSISSVKQYNVGQHIEFTLLTRAKNSVIPFEKEQYSFGALPYSIDGQCNFFSKFTLTSDAELSTNKAAEELTCWVEKVQSKGGEDLELLPYAFEAMDLLEQRKKAWTEHRASEYLSSSPPIKQQVMVQAKAQIYKHKADSFDSGGDAESMKVKSGDDVANSDNDSNKERTVISESINLGQVSAQNETTWEGDTLESPYIEEPFRDNLDAENQKLDIGSEIHKHVKNLEDKDLCKNQQERKESSDEESYSFYQSADGQLVILHPLNMRCLLHHYGSYDLLPPSIGGRILEMETVTQTEAIRKRYRYLSHFPLTTTFQLCEIDLSAILPASAFFPFKDEIEKREAERRRRRRQEGKARQKAAAAAALQARPTPSESIISTFDDKPPSSADFEALGELKDVRASPAAFEERRLFSHVTRLGLAAGYDSPALKESLPGDVSRGSSLSGSSSIEPVGSSAQSGTSSSQPMSFADIINATPKSGGQQCSSQSSGKKGKKATKVLLSTAGGRRY